MLSFNEQLVYYSKKALTGLRDTSEKVTDVILRSDSTKNGIKIQLAKLKSLNIGINRAKGRAKKLLCCNYSEKVSEYEKSLAAELFSEARKSEGVAEVLERKILLDQDSLAVAKKARAAKNRNQFASSFAAEVLMISEEVLLVMKQNGITLTDGEIEDLRSSIGRLAFARDLEKLKKGGE